MGGHGGDRGGFPSSGPWASLEEEMSSTELETGSIPVCAVETRTSPGEDNTASVRPISPRASSHHLSVVTEVQVALVACRKEEVDLWILVVLKECSKVAEVETEVASEVPLTWAQVTLVEEDEVVLGGPPRPLMEQVGGRRD